jgi:lipoate-protein ligase A
MAADDYIACSIFDTEYDATLRFYTWQPPAVSLGCHQKTDVINIPECNNRGWDVVYRSTGGRALLHRNDLSYSITLKSANDRFSRLHWLYNNISNAISITLEKLGIEADTTKPSPKRNTNLKTGLCLDARVRGEVSVKGKKIAAAAQHVYHDSLLQHGSIQLTGDPADIFKITNLPDEIREEVRCNLQNEACSLDSILNEVLKLEVLVEMIKVSIVGVMKLEIAESGWSDAELSVINELRADFDIASINSI